MYTSSNQLDRDCQTYLKHTLHGRYFILIICYFFILQQKDGDTWERELDVIFALQDKLTYKTGKSSKLSPAITVLEARNLFAIAYVSSCLSFGTFFHFNQLYLNIYLSLPF